MFSAPIITLYIIKQPTRRPHAVIPICLFFQTQHYSSTLIARSVISRGGPLFVFGILNESSSGISNGLISFFDIAIYLGHQLRLSMYYICYPDYDSTKFSCIFFSKTDETRGFVIGIILSTIYYDKLTHVTRAKVRRDT